MHSRMFQTDIVGRAFDPSVEVRGIRIPVGVKSKTEKLAPVVSLVSVHHLRHRTGLVDPVSV